MLDQPIRDPDQPVKSEEDRQKARDAYRAKKAAKKAAALATGEMLPKDEPIGPSRNPKGRPKSIVNRVTEYGALFNQLNQQRIDAGLPPLKTAMETLIEALQSEEMDIKDRARIAEKIASYESSRAPIISIEHVQNIVRDEEESSADEALDEFMESLRKV